MTPHERLKNALVSGIVKTTYVGNLEAEDRPSFSIVKAFKVVAIVAATLMASPVYAKGHHHATAVAHKTAAQLEDEAFNRAYKKNILLHENGGNKNILSVDVPMAKGKSKTKPLKRVFEGLLTDIVKSVNENSETILTHIKTGQTFNMTTAPEKTKYTNGGVDSYYNENVTDLSQEQTKQVFKEKYWPHDIYTNISPALAEKSLDFIVLYGRSGYIAMLARTVEDINNYRVIPKAGLSRGDYAEIKGINDEFKDAIIFGITQEAIKIAQNSNNKKNKKGWEKRAKDTFGSDESYAAMELSYNSAIQHGQQGRDAMSAQKITSSGDGDINIQQGKDAIESQKEVKMELKDMSKFTENAKVYLENRDNKYMDQQYDNPEDIPIVQPLEFAPR